jgi:hypothetical protein
VFDALVHGRVDTPLSFEVLLDDVEALNAMAADEALDVAKVSYHAAAHLADRWAYSPPAARSAAASGRWSSRASPERPSGPNRRRPGRPHHRDAAALPGVR